jgi:hypothetical protein
LSIDLVGSISRSQFIAPSLELLLQLLKLGRERENAFAFHAAPRFEHGGRGFAPFDQVRALREQLRVPLGLRLFSVGGIEQPIQRGVPGDGR